MNKKPGFLAILGVVLVVSSAVLLFLFSLPYSLNQQSGTYLPRKDGSESSLFLVDSQLYYGVYAQSFTRIGVHGFSSIKEGDPCIIINGTIRNDYDQDYFHLIGTEVKNVHGEEVGPIFSQSAPMPGFTVVFAEKDSTSVFDLRIPYNATDITEYKLLVKYEPSEIPPP